MADTDMKAYTIEELKELWRKARLTLKFRDAEVIWNLIFTAVDAIASQREAEYRNLHEIYNPDNELRQWCQKCGYEDSWNECHSWSHSRWLKDVAAWMEEK